MKKRPNSQEKKKHRLIYKFAVSNKKTKCVVVVIKESYYVKVSFKI